MRAVLSILLTLSLVTLMVPGVTAETYRYVATGEGLSLGCHDDLLTGTDGICIGSVTFALADESLLFSVDDDLYGSSAAYSVCLHDSEGCDEDSTRFPVTCGTQLIVGPTASTHATVFFSALWTTDDLDVCGATTGTITV